MYFICLLIAEQSAPDCHESEPLPSPGRSVLLLICNSPITVRQTRLIIIVNIVKYPMGAAINVHCTKPCKLSCMEYYHSRPEHTNLTAASPILPCFEPNAAPPSLYPMIYWKYVNKKIMYTILVFWSCFKPFCNIKSQNKTHAIIIFH